MLTELNAPLVESSLPGTSWGPAAPPTPPLIFRMYTNLNEPFAESSLPRSSLSLFLSFFLFFVLSFFLSRSLSLSLSFCFLPFSSRLYLYKFFFTACENAASASNSAPCLAKVLRLQRNWYLLRKCCACRDIWTAPCESPAPAVRLERNM